MRGDRAVTHSKIIAFSLLGTVMMGFHLFVIQPYIDSINESRTEITSLQDQILRFKKVINNKGTHQNELKQLQNNRLIKGYFLQGKTHALASAKLQQIIKSTVNAKGGALLSTQMVSVEEYDNQNKDIVMIQPVSVKVSMKATLDAVREIFFSLESRQPVFTLNRVAIRKIHVGRRINQHLTKPQELLQVDYEVTAYMSRTI